MTTHEELLRLHRRVKRLVRARRMLARQLNMMRDDDLRLQFGESSSPNPFEGLQRAVTEQEMTHA